ncbi:MAG TPA: hypothetical protein VFG51_02900 [Candidatus Saccharimonadia bacterium]|nr:hypothetical protein [Candidatus Saccharimonadia bacterium]
MPEKDIRAVVYKDTLPPDLRELLDELQVRGSVDADVAAFLRPPYIIALSYTDAFEVVTGHKMATRDPKKGPSRSGEALASLSLRALGYTVEIVDEGTFKHLAGIQAQLSSPNS